MVKAHRPVVALTLTSGTTSSTNTVATSFPTFFYLTCTHETMNKGSEKRSASVDAFVFFIKVTMPFFQRTLCVGILLLVPLFTIRASLPRW